MTPSMISPELAKRPAASLTTTFDDTLRFYLNGTRVVLDDIDPEVTLLEYLRGIGLTGTKLYVAALHIFPLPPAIAQNSPYIQTYLTDRTHPHTEAAAKAAAAPAR